jgi:thymidylate synthase (FAD)
MSQNEVTYIDHMGSDLSVVNAARVSFGKKSEALGTSGIVGETMTPILNDPDKKLIKYLAKHRHMSPFGHAFVSFHVKAPIFAARQLVKHKFLRWNEISRRYVDDKPEFYEPDVWRGRADDKKQGSAGAVESVPVGALKVQGYCLAAYQDLLSSGICPEQARMVLPQSTMTEWYWSGSLDAFADMCRLRCKEDTQAETQEVAWAISLKMEDLFPLSWVALRDE